MREMSLVGNNKITLNTQSDWNRAVEDTTADIIDIIAEQTESSECLSDNSPVHDDVYEVLSSVSKYSAIDEPIMSETRKSEDWDFLLYTHPLQMWNDERKRLKRYLYNNHYQPLAYSNPLPTAKVLPQDKEVKFIPPSAVSEDKKQLEKIKGSKFDYYVGSKKYFEELDNRISYSRNGNTRYKRIIELMMKDFDTYGLPNKYWNEYCHQFTKYVKSYGTVTKDMHYFRNRLNRAPATLNDMYKAAGRWNLLDPFFSQYHMYGEDGEFNVKFVSKDGMYEAVYNKNGELLTGENDPVNMGTFNYADPNFFEGLWHQFYDVDPYKEWGNVGGHKPTEDSKYSKYLTSYSAKKHYERVKEKFNGAQR